MQRRIRFPPKPEGDTTVKLGALTFGIESLASRNDGSVTLAISSLTHAPAEHPLGGREIRKCASNGCSHLRRSVFVNGRVDHELEWHGLLAPGGSRASEGGKEANLTPSAPSVHGWLSSPEISHEPLYPIAHSIAVRFGCSCVVGQLTDTK